jgi:hypothetical protein
MFAKNTTKSMLIINTAAWDMIIKSTFVKIPKKRHAQRFIKDE